MAEPIPLLPREGAQARVDGEPLDVASWAVALARSAAPLRRALAAIAGRLVAVRAWEPLGFARLRDYADEGAGVSGRQLQELARVDAALAGLPHLESAFLGGRLSWTQLRLLVRVASADDEAAWLERASQLTARALAREVRRVDARSLEAGGAATGLAAGGSDGEEQRVGIRLRLEGTATACWGRSRLLASRMAGRRLVPWEALELVTAEVLSTIPFAAIDAVEAPEPAVPEGTPDGDEGSGPAAVPARSASSAANRCAPQGFGESPHPPTLPLEPGPEVPFLASLLEGLEDADPCELDARLHRALRLEQQLLARLGPLLLAMARGRLYRRYGFGSFAQFAREWLGIGERKAQALVRLERAGHACPTLRQAWRTGQLSWVRAHLLVPLLLLEEAEPHGAAWVTRAGRVSVRRLEDEVDHALATGALAPPPLDPWAEPQTGARPRAAGRAARFWISAPRDVARLFRATLASVQRRLECLRGVPVSESDAFVAICEHACESWRCRPGPIPKEHRVFVRDGWRCAVPGCSSQANLHAHHVIFRSAGGSDAPSNLITLCAWHHQRGVHGGLVRIQGRAPDRLRFELGVRSDRPPLAVYLSGDRVA